jgi:Transcriptional regulators containing a DNA-binding HTH domain and an aminotransferase domain (MocR family) and their eukaryotic orthologs
VRFTCLLDNFENAQSTHARLMAAEHRDEIVDAMRGRLLRGIQAGTLQPGDRLPGSREVAAEFETDYRAAIAAYKALQEEGLVELRPRGGVYIAPRRNGPGGIPPVSETWIADIFAAALNRGIGAPDLIELLPRCVDTLRLRATVIAETDDQVQGLCRELRDDFGFESEGVLANVAREADPAPLAVRRADLLVTVNAHAEWVAALGRELRKEVIVIAVRPELRQGEWTMLLRRPVYVVVATAQFGEMLRRFYAEISGIENLRIIVFGVDDLSSIPDGAPTYVTQGVRKQLGATRVPGRIIPAARTIAAESAREILTFVVRQNLEVLGKAEY